MELHEIAYTSRAVHLMSDTELDGLLEIARAKNARLGITGMLLYKDLSFLQVLEGDRSTISEVLDTIRQDMRHQNLRVLADRPLMGRNFSDWSMGFTRLDGEVDGLPDGFSGLMSDVPESSRLSLPERDTLAYALLMTFRRLS